MKTRLVPMWILLLLGLLASTAAGGDDEADGRRGPDRLDVESGAKIRELTTDPSFLTPWVDHLPASETVPSPTAYLGHVIGAPDRLTPPEEINAYFRTLAQASPRVRVFSMGRSHGGREMIVAAIADAAILERLRAIQSANRELADPRVTGEERARELARSTPPIYWITAGLHSPETGPPEMVMELAYRLAVSEQRHIRRIRAGVVTLITPVLEMDGRARMVDWYRRYLTEVTDLEESPPRMAPYWGDYTVHDNNRDGLQQSQPLTRNFTDTYFEFLPVVSLDLHESVPLLYVSTGTGPYNDAVDPITVTEWQWISSYEVSECTRLGLRGVWTWGFYTGWYPGYLLWVPNNHNAIGRFYETFGSGLPGTFKRKLRDAMYADRRLNSRQWYRVLPPEQEVLWSLRDNTNYMQTGVLASLELVARNGERLLYNFWRKCRNAIDRGLEEPPHAFLIPARQRDRGNLRRLLWLLSRHRIEVHRLDVSARLAGGIEVERGDFLVRMDQPYRNFARTLLMRQSFPKTAELDPYDDVAWSLDLMLGVEVEALGDASILEAPMEPLAGIPELPGRAQTGGSWLVEHRAQTSLASFVYDARRRSRSIRMRALAEEWREHPAGSIIIEGLDHTLMEELARTHHLDAIALEEPPEARTVEVGLPRIGLFHTWTYTQDSGWARHTLEELGILYTLINKDHLRRGGLGEAFDVVIIPSQGRADLKRIVHGIDPKWGPMPYTRTQEFSSHGVIDSSPDITGGMGFEGLAELQRFVEEGGLLIALGSGGTVPAAGGIVRRVETRPRGANPGSHLTARVLRPEHPVVWGYPRVTHVFRGNLPLFEVRNHDWGRIVMQYGVKTRAEAEREADEKADIPVAEPPVPPGESARERGPTPPLCLSGRVKDESALERRAAILDITTGRGRVLIYSFNPLHRHQNHHDVAFLSNALLFHRGFPEVPPEEEMWRRERERDLPADE